MPTYMYPRDTGTPVTMRLRPLAPPIAVCTGRAAQLAAGILAGDGAAGVSLAAV
jgi:hypothetical protein